MCGFNRYKIHLVFLCGSPKFSQKTGYLVSVIDILRHRDHSGISLRMNDGYSIAAQDLSHLPIDIHTSTALMPWSIYSQCGSNL